LSGDPARMSSRRLRDLRRAPDEIGFVTVGPMETTAVGPGVTSRGGRGRDVAAVRQAMKVAAAESAATWLVRRCLELGYRRATGRVLPTARDRDTPIRQVLVWASVTGAALSAATVIVDQVALRRAAPPKR
jgi:Protein of unknown function (DUF4235)